MTEQYIPRERILSAAKTWIDTPYQHQASVKGAGCDCLGLIRGVWREIYGAEPLEVPVYTPDWAESLGQEPLLDAAKSCLRPIAKDTAQPGDILLFRMAPNVPCKHIAILSAPDRIIHAYWGRAVTESFLVPYWTRRHAYSFSFPTIEA
jgi:NlpC/P60 family putative phage cell wall peptidase